jgi:hypothetical protein
MQLEFTRLSCGSAVVEYPGVLINDAPVSLTESEKKQRVAIRKHLIS